MPRGTPQIEVSFDIDSNGILNVTALEKSTGKSNKVEITNDKSRLSKEDVEKMTADAEKYAKEDEEFKEKVDAKNSLEGYCFSMQSVLSDEKNKDKLLDEDSAKASDLIKETLQWLQENSSALKKNMKVRKKRLRKRVSQLWMK